VTPLYPQKLALTSPTGGGRSVGIVRSRTKATEFSFSLKRGKFKVRNGMKEITKRYTNNIQTQIMDPVLW